jgi:multiple sugar transport system permease protein
MEKPSFIYGFYRLQTVFVILVLGSAVISLVPLYWTISSSFQTNEAVMQLPPQWIPVHWTWLNYNYLLEHTLALRWLGNSTVIAVISASLIVYLSTLAAYPLAKKTFPGSKFLFFLVLGFMTIPREVILLPLFLMKQFISTIPSDIFDAAQMDGCSQLQTFHLVLLPMLKPGLGALAVFAFVHSWNDYIWQLIIVSSDSMKTLPLGVSTLSDEFVNNYAVLMAGATLGSVPLLVVFIVFQRFFTSGITLGAVKG